MRRKRGRFLVLLTPLIKFNRSDTSGINPSLFLIVMHGRQIRISYWTVVDAGKRTEMTFDVLSEISSSFPRSVLRFPFYVSHVKIPPPSHVPFRLPQIIS